MYVKGTGDRNGRSRDNPATNHLERGAGLAEYALLLLFVTLVSILAVTTLGITISGMFNTVTSMF